MVKLRPHQNLRFTMLHKTFVRWYEGPSKILKRIDKVSYKLKMPQKYKFYPIFHASLLKPFRRDSEDPDREKPKRFKDELQQQHTTRALWSLVGENVTAHKLKDVSYDNERRVTQMPSEIHITHTRTTCHSDARRLGKQRDLVVGRIATF